MPFLKRIALPPVFIALIFAAVALSTREARADGIVITSGYVNIGGAPFSRNQWKSISFNFAGKNFAASGGSSDGVRQGVQTLCGLSPCAAGALAEPNSTAILDGVGRATFNGTTSNAWWYADNSQLTFNGMGITIPDSTAATITLTTNFAMSGSVYVYSLDTQAPLFSTTISGSGIATLTLEYFANRGGYILDGIRYDFTSTPVPEPGTLLLLGTGLLGVAARFRRRRTD